MMTFRQTYIPCANGWCGNEIDARRAALGHVGAQNFTLCADCNASNHKFSAEARERAPQYETLALSRGERLDGPGD